jgi:MFS family permease
MMFTMADERLLTKEFVAVGLCGSFYMGAFGIALPVLPLYVRDVLGGGDALVGFVFGSFAIASLFSRPIVGRIGDRLGRHVLLVIGAACGALAFAGQTLFDTTPWMFAMRLVWGVGFAAHIVGTMSLAVDLAPANRRGEAAAFLLVGNHVGIGIGATFGAIVVDRWSFDAIWLVCAAVAASSGFASLLVPHHELASLRAPARRGWFHPAGVRTGVLQAFGGLGFVGFQAFVALYSEEIGLSSVGPVLATSSATLIAIRVIGRKLPDALGPIRGVALALMLVGIGATTMGIWDMPVGLFVATVIMGSGHGLLIPNLVATTVVGLPINQRSSALSTLNMFQDVSLVLGPVILGIAASIGGYRAAFMLAGILAWGALALVLGLSRFAKPDGLWGVGGPIAEPVVSADN